MIARKRGRRGGRRRGKAAQIMRRAHAMARERQDAWSEGGQPNVTASLTTDLNGREHVYRPEGLFAEARQARSGDADRDDPRFDRKAKPLAEVLVAQRSKREGETIQVVLGELG